MKANKYDTKPDTEKTVDDVFQNGKAENSDKETEPIKEQKTRGSKPGIKRGAYKKKKTESVDADEPEKVFDDDDLTDVLIVASGMIVGLTGKTQYAMPDQIAEKLSAAYVGVLNKYITSFKYKEESLALTLTIQYLTGGLTGSISAGKRQGSPWTFNRIKNMFKGKKKDDES